MKFIISLATIFTLFFSGCANSKKDLALASIVHNYKCKSGEIITAIYPTTNSATVQYKESSYDMKIAISGSGSRYVGGELEWRTKGSEGILFQHMPDGASGYAIEFCEEL
ncbi:MAG: lysozyme inhibitor [Campylobacteraceae bacterium]|nr:lysozyme inhibitor [Campylobacteraceae bacterium]